MGDAMRCNNCSKFIPEVSVVCPYCSAPVLNNEKKVVDFGNIENTNYVNNKFDIKVHAMGGKNSKYIFVVGIPILVILVVILFIFLLTRKSDADYRIFTSTLDVLTEYLEDNFISSKTSSSGKYQMTLNVNGEGVAFDGEYGYDVKNRILNLTGVMKDPKEAVGGIIIDTKDLEFSAYMKDNNFYFQSDEIYGNDYIYFLINDATGLLATKNYDLYSLVIGSSDALKDTLKIMNYETTSEKINYLGQEISLTKRSLVLDNKGKIKFLSTFFNNLIDDANFINEMARISNKKNDEVIKTLENYITTAEYKYSNESSNKTTISIYFNKRKVYRILVDKDEEKKEKYNLDIGDIKYYLDYFVDDTNVYSATLAVTKKELSALTEKNYVITFDKDDLVTDMTLYLEENVQSNVKRQDIANFKDIREFNEEEYQLVKNNMRYYISDISFIDRIRDYYKEKCTLDLQCVCEEDTCSCTYNNEIITCPKDLVTSTAIALE